MKRLNKLNLFFIIFTNISLASNNEYTIKEIINLSLENNFDIKISKNQNEIANLAILTANSEFDLNLKMNFTHDKKEIPLSSALDGSGDSTDGIESLDRNSSINLSKKLSLTGTNLTIPLSNNISFSESTSRLIEETHTTSAGYNISQPLIRAFVKGYFNKRVLSEEINSKQANLKNKEKIEDTLINILNAYFSYLENKINFSIYENTFNSSKRNLDFINAKTKIGSASIIDQIDAQNNFYKADENLLRQKITLQKSLENLKILVFNDPKYDAIFKDSNLMQNNFNFNLNLENEFLKALKNDQTYQSSILEIEKNNLNKKYSNIDLYPNLTLDYTKTYTGLNDNFADAKEEVSDQKFESTKIALTLNQPIFRYAKKGSDQINQLKLDQEKLKLQNLKKNLYLDLELLIKELTLQQKIISSLKLSKEAELTKYDFYEKKYKNGQISSFDLIKHQESKDKINLDYIKAVYKLEKDILKYSKLTGSLFNLLKVNL